METLITIIFVLVVYNRWYLFKRFFGETGMYLIDALICTVAAAKLIAVPGSSPVFNYFLATFSIIVALFSAKNFVRLVGKEKNADD